jgi:hypothetical protein
MAGSNFVAARGRTEALPIVAGWEALAEVCSAPTSPPARVSQMQRLARSGHALRAIASAMATWLWDREADVEGHNTTGQPPSRERLIPGRKPARPPSIRPIPTFTH